MKLYEGAFLPNFQWPQPKPEERRQVKKKVCLDIFEEFSVENKSQNIKQKEDT